MSVVSRKYIAVPPLKAGGTYTVAIRELIHTPLMEGIKTQAISIELTERLNSGPSMWKWAMLTAHWLGIMSWQRGLRL